MEKAEGHPFDPEKLISTSIANITTKIVTGISYEYDDDEFRHVMMLSQRIFDLLGPAGLLSTLPMLAKIPTPSNRELTKAWSGIYDFIRESINRHKSAAGDEEGGVDFISSYLQEMAGKTSKVNSIFVRILCHQGRMIGGVKWVFSMTALYFRWEPVNILV